MAAGSERRFAHWSRRRATVIAATALVVALGLVAIGIVLVSKTHLWSGPSPVQVEGGSAQCELHGCVEDLVDTVVGSLHPVAVDLQPDPLRPDLDLVRQYDSTVSQGSFGPGWRSLVDVRLSAGPRPHLLGAVSTPTLPADLFGREARFADGARWNFGSDGLIVGGTSSAGVRFSIERGSSHIVIRGPTTETSLRLALRIESSPHGSDHATAREARLKPSSTNMTLPASSGR